MSTLIVPVSRVATAGFHSLSFSDSAGCGFGMVKVNLAGVQVWISHGCLGVAAVAVPSGLATTWIDVGPQTVR